MSDGERCSRAELERQLAESKQRLENEIEARQATEAELRTSQAKLRRLFESDILGIFVADTLGAIHEANDAMLRMIGYSRSELERGLIRWDERTPPEWAQLDMDGAKRLVEHGSVSAFEKEFIRKDGSRFPILIGAALLENSSTDCIAFVLDISARKKAQNELACLNEALEARVEERTRTLRASEQRAERTATVLAVSKRRLRALAARLETVREEERKGLAREIHDVLGQELTGLKMDAAWILRHSSARGSELEPACAERLHAMLQQLDSSIATVRSIATRLRPAVLDDLGLVAAIEWQARDFAARAGVLVDLELPAHHVSPGQARSTALFRILQELLTNIARHANARRVVVRLEQEGDALTLEVRDDGDGIADDQGQGSGGLGVLGIRERAQAFGGRLELSGGPTGGTIARVTIPLAPEEDGS